MKLQKWGDQCELNGAPAEKSNSTEEAISNRRKYAYFPLKYGYIASGLVVDYFRIALLYSGINAWIQDINDGENDSLTYISYWEALSLLLYYVLFC
jgi:hypothetical protein